MRVWLLKKWVWKSSCLRSKVQFARPLPVWAHRLVRIPALTHLAQGASLNLQIWGKSHFLSLFHVPWKREEFLRKHRTFTRELSQNRSPSRKENQLTLEGTFFLKPMCTLSGRIAEGRTCLCRPYAWSSYLPALQVLGESKNSGLSSRYPIPEFFLRKESVWLRRVCPVLSDETSGLEELPSWVCLLLGVAKRHPSGTCAEVVAHPAGEASRARKAR